MAKILSKVDLDKCIQDAFFLSPNVNTFHVTPDGNCFENESYATHHAKFINAKQFIAQRADYITADVQKAAAKAAKNSIETAKKTAEDLQKKSDDSKAIADKEKIEADAAA